MKKYLVLFIIAVFTTQANALNTIVLSETEKNYQFEVSESDFEKAKVSLAEEIKLMMQGFYGNDSTVITRIVKVKLNAKKDAARFGVYIKVKDEFGDLKVDGTFRFDLNYNYNNCGLWKPYLVIYESPRDLVRYE